MSWRATWHQGPEEPLTFVFCRARALIAIDEVAAGASIQAGRGEALVVFLLTVEAVVA